MDAVGVLLNSYEIITSNSSVQWIKKKAAKLVFL
jgi:hypothetical protein